MTSSQLGSWGEDVAVEYLRQSGYRILERNWHTSDGEVDAIADHRATVVFVEVKARTSDAFGPPEASVTKAKQLRLQRAAWQYLESVDRLDAEWRIDVIAIERADNGEIARLDHYVNAVEGVRDLRRP